MGERSHFENFSFSYFRNAVVICLDAQLYHSREEPTIFLVELTCKNEILAKFCKCTIVSLCGYSTSNECSMYHVVTGIVETIGR